MKNESTLADPKKLSLRVRGAISFCREEFYNDGAEGESVHLLCDTIEAQATEIAELKVKLFAADSHHAEHHAREEHMCPMCVACESQPNDCSPCSCDHAPCVHDHNTTRAKLATAEAELAELLGQRETKSAEIEALLSINESLRAQLSVAATGLAAAEAARASLTLATCPHGVVLAVDCHKYEPPADGAGR